MSKVKNMLRVILVLLIGAGVAQASPKIEKQTWKKNIHSQVVEIENEIGDVRIRSGGQAGEMEAIAMVQHNESKGQLQVREDIDDARYRLTVERVDPRTGQVLPLDQGDQARIDLTVFVPPGRTLVQVKTKDGLIEAKKMRDPLVLRSQGGAIKLRDNKNSIDAATRLGQITANLKPIKSSRAQRFNTQTGAIEIWIAEDSAQSVSLSTSGDIISDFSTQVERDLSQEPNKLARIEANGGGGVIEASSKIGSVAYKAIPINKPKSNQ